MARILYVEDDVWQVKPTIAVLKAEYGHEIVLQTGIDNATDALTREPFDIVLFDVMLNGGKPITFAESAFELLRQIRSGAFSSASNGSDLPVIFATGVADMSMTWQDGSRVKVREGMTRMGVATGSVLIKPYTADEVHELVLRLTLNEEGETLDNDN